MLEIAENPQAKRIEKAGFDIPHSIVCPACGKANRSEAVFCANPDCHKALGEFKYVGEELQTQTRWHQAPAERISSFIGNPSFLVVHAAWFAIWVTVNTGIRLSRRYLTLILLVCSGSFWLARPFITGFLLISQNRQNVHADKRAELDYEVNVRTYREIQKIKDTLGAIEQRFKPNGLE